MDNEVVASTIIVGLTLLVIIPMLLFLRQVKKESDQLDKEQAAREKSKATLGI